MATTLNRCAVEVDLCLQRGDTQPFGFDILNEDGTPATIAGFTYVFTVNTSPVPVGGTPAATFSATGTISGNTVSINLSPAEADQLGTLYYDLQETDLSGLIRTVAKGKVEWQQDISK
jgi:hypothetical protein